MISCLQQTLVSSKNAGTTYKDVDSLLRFVRDIFLGGDLSSKRRKLGASLITCLSAARRVARVRIFERIIPLRVRLYTTFMLSPSPYKHSSGRSIHPPKQ